MTEGSLPLIEEDTSFLKKTTRKRKAVFGLAFRPEHQNDLGVIYSSARAVDADPGPLEHLALPATAPGAAPCFSPVLLSARSSRES